MAGRGPSWGRPPSLRNYLVAGAVCGFLAGAALALFGEEVPVSSPLQQVVVLGLFAAALGGLVAAVVYLVVDWRRDHPNLR